MENGKQQTAEPNYTELLEKKYRGDKSAERIIRSLRNLGHTDKDIYEDLEELY